MTINYQFKKDNLDQGETVMRKEADLDLRLRFPRGAKLSSLPWSTVKGRDGCEKGSFHQMSQDRVCACV